MIINLTSEQIQKAADWWSEVIQKPKFDNGVKTLVEGMAGLLQLKLVQPVEESQVQVFKGALTGLLLKKPVYKIYCDYHPDETLCKALDIANISRHNCPWKTTMTFNEEGEVFVTYGYNADEQKL
jgi:hypothetical protein